MITAPQLFGRSRGMQVRTGQHRCFYCGGKTGEFTQSREHVKDSFTARDTVCGGDWVCDGCVEAMNESGTVQLIDGEIREGQKLRCYSYVVTANSCYAATKAHRAELLSICLSPPNPPYVICLSDSGQKHLLYRAVVCQDEHRVIVTLEGQRIYYAPADLEKRLTLCKKIVAATGKPALSEPLSPRSAMRIIEHHGDESLPDLWMRVMCEPLSSLAGWLCPPKEECLVEYPITAAVAPVEHRRISAEARGPSRSPQRTLFD